MFNVKMLIVFILITLILLGFLDSTLRDILDFLLRIMDTLNGISLGNL